MENHARAQPEVRFIQKVGRRMFKAPEGTGNIRS
jgi:hypothetical protein